MIYRVCLPDPTYSGLHGVVLLTVIYRVCLTDPTYSGLQGVILLTVVYMVRSYLQ